MFDVNSQILTLENGSTIDDLAIATGQTVYTKRIPVGNNAGFSVVTAEENKAGGAGSVAITPVYTDEDSDSGADYDINYTTSAGALTVDPAIVSVLQNTKRRITFTARMAKWMKYKIVTAAASQLTLRHTFQEQY